MPFLSSITSLFARPPREDAFSLPRTQYETSAADGSPGPSRRGSYQPPSVAAGAQASFPAGSSAPGRYPPLSHTFHRLRVALADTFPELIDGINHPATPEALAEFEQQLGSPLPPSVRESFLTADGQDLDTGPNGGLFYGLYLLPLEEVLNEWLFWRQVEMDPRAGANPAVLATMASIPPQWVKSQYSCAGWVPLISDRTGNYIGVDLDPGPGGVWGQTIIFGRDFDRKCVLWRGEGEAGWAKWLAGFVDEVESGEGWEGQDKVSDEEDEVGYTSYSAADVYGEGGQGLRLAGEYKGWNVLEAWWDKSVRKWEGLGLGMDVAEIERGLSEARRLTTTVKGKEKAVEPQQPEEVRESIELRPEQRTPEIPSTTEDEALLPAASPVMSPVSSPVPRILHPPSMAPPLRTTPASDHPLQDSELLHPPARKKPTAGPSGPSGSGARRRPPPPAPAMLDLPTRADVQAAEAVHEAEQSGLRGGWVMSLDTSAAAAQRRPHQHDSMVNIDLEDGRQEDFGAAQMRPEDLARQRIEDRLAYAGIEQRRSAGNTPVDTSAPLSRGSTGNTTPRESAYATPSGTPPLGSLPGVASAIRRPPPIADQPRAHSPVTGDSLTGEVLRGMAARRPSAQSNSSHRRESLTPSPILQQRENSIMSVDSAEGLLAGGSPATPTNKRTSANGAGAGIGIGTNGALPVAPVVSEEPGGIDDVAGELEEIHL